MAAFMGTSVMDSASKLVYRAPRPEETSPRSAAGAQVRQPGGRETSEITSMKRPPVRRAGRVIRQRAGDRWTAEVLLEEGKGAERREVIVSLAQRFATEEAATRAGGEIVAQWKRNGILREVLLRELAATYRALRE